MDAKPYTEAEWQKECATGEDTDGHKMTALFKQIEDLKTALSIATARADMMESAAYRAQEALEEILDGPGICNVRPCAGHCGFGAYGGCEAIKEFLSDHQKGRK